MSATEWESLCDGCGLCCQISQEDEDTGELTLTNTSCEYLCLNSHCCKDYENRQQNVPDCVKVTPDNEAPTIPKATKYHGDDFPALKKSSLESFLPVK